MPDSGRSKLRVVGGAGATCGLPPLLDFAVIDDLRARLGVFGFDELYEDAVFEITERLAAIETAMRRRAFARVGSLAEKLGADAMSIGFARCAAIARDLAQAVAADDVRSATALAERLISVGEDSLISVASLTGGRGRDRC